MTSAKFNIIRGLLVGKSLDQSKQKSIRLWGVKNVNAITDYRFWCPPLNALLLKYICREEIIFVKFPSWKIF